MNKKKKILIIILSLLVLILGVISIYFLIPKKNGSNSKVTKSINNIDLEKVNDILDKKYLVNDYFYISYNKDGYNKENNSYYKAKIKYPNVLFKDYGSTIYRAYYTFKNSEVSLSLSFDTYDNEEKLKKNFIYDNEEYIDENNYKILYKDYETKVYYKTDYGFYQTINLYTGKNFNKIDKKNIINLIKNITYEKINPEELAINIKDGYYIGNLKYSYLDSNYKYSYINASYKINTKDYNSKANKNLDDYNPNTINYFNTLSFSKGNITADFRSLYELSLINISIGLNKNMDEKNIDSKIESCKKNIANCENIMSDAWLNANRDDIKFEKGSFKHLDYDVYYYKASYYSKEKDKSAESIFAYLKINDNYTYNISYLGGDYKKISLDDVKEFLPTKLYIEEK